ncbi:MAG: cytochrome c [Desulfobacteraceae bacterium]|jgi:mono/diheme cytochrome c family protein|nr:cytochrome c [Desulfobacteraceae bacterium]
MLQKMGSILIVVVFLFVSIGMVMAEDKGNARKGKYLFRKNCRACHVEGGTAKALSPIDKTQAQWDEVFSSIDKLPCAKEWEKLSEEDRNDINAYLWGHAFDSPSPAKCK